MAKLDLIVGLVRPDIEGELNFEKLVIFMPGYLRKRKGEEQDSNSNSSTILDVRTLTLISHMAP